MGKKRRAPARARDEIVARWMAEAAGRLVRGESDDSEDAMFTDIVSEYVHRKEDRILEMAMERALDDPCGAWLLQHEIASAAEAKTIVRDLGDNGVDASMAELFAFPALIVTRERDLRGRIRIDSDRFMKEAGKSGMFPGDVTCVIHPGLFIPHSLRFSVNTRIRILEDLAFRGRSRDLDKALSGEPETGSVSDNGMIMIEARFIVGCVMYDDSLSVLADPDEDRAKAFLAGPAEEIVASAIRGIPEVEVIVHGPARFTDAMDMGYENFRGDSLRILARNAIYRGATRVVIGEHGDGYKLIFADRNGESLGDFDWQITARDLALEHNPKDSMIQIIEEVFGAMNPQEDDEALDPVLMAVPEGNHTVH